MKIKLFVTCEIQYFELRIFSFNSYVYYLGRGFIASTRAFNLLTPEFELVTREFELVTRGFELLTRGFELVTPGFEFVTRNSCFTFPPLEVIRHVTFHKNRISVDSDKQWTNKIHGWDWQEYTNFFLYNFSKSN